MVSAEHHDALLYDVCADEYSGTIVNDDAAMFEFVSWRVGLNGVECCEGREIPFGTAGNDLCNFVEVVVLHDILHTGEVFGVCYDVDFVNEVRFLKRCNGVFEDGFPSDNGKLFGYVEPSPNPFSCGEYNGDVVVAAAHNSC